MSHKTIGKGKRRDAAAVPSDGTTWCIGCGALSPAIANFCSQCGASLVDREARDDETTRLYDRSDSCLIAEPERRQLTVVFCDLVDSTGLAAAVDLEDFRDIIETFSKAVAGAMTAFGGYVARYMGDGVLVYFGYPEAHEDDAERAVHASLKTLDDVASLGVLGQRRLQARVGIATGLVIVGNIHAASTIGALDVAGETGNLAARLQGSAQPDTIVVAHATRRVVGELFNWRDLGALSLKGFREPVQAWQVIGAKSVPSRFDAQHDISLVPMLGRDEYRETLRRAWDKAREGSGQTVLISGEAGVGKSRLAVSILEETKREAHATLRYFTSPYRQASPLFPCIQQLEHKLGFLREDTQEMKRTKLERGLVGAPEQDLALIAELLNLPADKDTGRQLSAQVKRRRTMQALLGQLERIARDLPTLMIFEDAQWSDESSRELLGQVVARLARLPVLLLVTARPEFRPEWTTRAPVTTINLNPLSAEISAELVRCVAREHPLPPRVISDIVARTDGVPLFIEEVTRAVLEAQTGRVTPEPNYGPTVPPPLILQASLLARLDRLGRAREIAEVAAAIGRDFTSDLLALVVDSPEQVPPLLGRLVESGLVLRRGVEKSDYTFKHALIRDAAYGIMTRDKRRALHSRIAEALEQHFADTIVNQPEILAWHYSAANLIEKAVPYWLTAGQQALRRSAMAEALRHLGRGMEVIAGAEESHWRLQSELDLMIAIGKAQIATQGYAMASTRDTFLKAHNLCERLGDPPQLLAVLHGLWTHELLRGEFPTAQGRAEQVLARGEARNDSMWLLMGYRFSGVTQHPLGNFHEARRRLELGLELYDPAKQTMYWALTVDDPRIVMLTYLSWSRMCLGEFADARRLSEQSVTEARQMAHVYTLAHALNGASFVALTIDTPEAALRRLDDLAEVLADNGIAYYDAVEKIFRGWCLAATGNFDDAIPLLQRAMADYRATGSLLYLSGFLRMSAEAHCGAGRYTEATELIRESIAIVESTGQRWDEAECRRVHGTVLRACGNCAAAEEALVRACLVAREHGARLWWLRASCALAELYMARDTPGLVGEVLKPVLASFDELSDAPDLRRARRLLETIEPTQGRLEQVTRQDNVAR